MVARRLLSVGAMALGALALAAPAGAYTAKVEQVDRSSGVTGGSSLAGGWSEPRYVTDDGRFALFDFTQTSPNRLTQTPTERATSGVYLRDTVSDTLRQLAKGNTETSGVTLDHRTISVVTEEPLVAADTNGRTDLYLVDLATGTPTLAPTTGAVRGGAITADGQAIVWSNATGTDRRTLPSGPIEHLSDAPMAMMARNGSPVPYTTPVLRNRTLLSRDGRLAVVTGPTGRPQIAGVGSAIGLDGFEAILSPDGRRAIYRNDGGGVSVKTLATGAVQSFGSDATLHGVQFIALTGDGTRAVYLNRLGYVRSIDLTTGALVTLAGQDYTLRQTTVVSSDLGFVFQGWFKAYVVPRTRALPEPADLPDVFAFVSFDEGCTASAQNFLIPPIRPTFRLAPATWGVRGATIAISRPNGQLIGRWAIAPGKDIGAAIGWVGGWTVDAAVTLDDGRVIRGRWQQRSYTGTPVCPTFYL